jgi:hypothetical protein
MGKLRIRFEPIDVTDYEDFEYLYHKLRKIINSAYEDDHDEIIPDIRIVYPVDDMGFPINPDTPIP